METPEGVSTSSQTGEWGMSIDFNLLPYTNKSTVQDIPAFSCPGSILLIQRSTIWSDHCSNRIHSGSQGSQTDGSKQGYKNTSAIR